jgi:hypothetical protein
MYLKLGTLRHEYQIRGGLLTLAGSGTEPGQVWCPYLNSHSICAESPPLVLVCRLTAQRAGLDGFDSLLTIRVYGNEFLGQPLTWRGPRCGQISSSVLEKSLYEYS